MNYLIKEIITNAGEMMNMFHEFSSRAHNLIPQAVKEGLSLSKRVCAEPEYVVATPLMKNILKRCGDINDDNNKIRTGEHTSAVDLVNEIVDKLLKEVNHKSETFNGDYSKIKAPISSVEYYDADCINGWKPKIWDIQPGVAKERKDVLREYQDSRTNACINYVMKLLQEDPVLQKAVQIEYSLLPDSHFSEEMSDTNMPFRNKKTGTSYPYYRNDSSPVPDTTETYGQFIVNLVEKRYKAGGLEALVKMALDNNVYTAYPRNQRGKGRALEAMSRITNVVINSVNGGEMASLKTDRCYPWNIPFSDVDKMRNHLTAISERALKLGLTTYNLDYSKWDKNLGAGWVFLQDVMRFTHANGSKARRIIAIRAYCNLYSTIIDGPNNYVGPCYGRMMSGYIDTTVGNTSAQRLISRFCAMKANPKHTTNVTYKMELADIVALGDDLLITLEDESFIKKFIDVANKICGVIIHEDEKHAKGTMFLQWRAFVDPHTNNWIIAYNWPRVWRSMLSKEDPVGLGPAGWTLSFYQQIGKCIEYEDSLKILANLAYEFDDYHLMLDKSVKEIIEMTKDEDLARIPNNTKNRKAKLRRTRQTSEVLFHNNTDIPGVLTKANGEVVIDENYFNGVQMKIKAAIDPDFFAKHGITVPRKRP